MDKGNTVVDAGLVDIAMSYRKELMPDQGLCIQVYSEIEGKDTEILRFDCFDQDPTTTMDRRTITSDCTWTRQPLVTLSAGPWTTFATSCL